MSWDFLTSHAQVLLCIAQDPGGGLRDIAASPGIIERSAHGIVTDLAAAGYVVKQEDGRRNRYQIQARMPLREPASLEPAISEVLAPLAGTRTARHRIARASDLAASGTLQAGPQASSTRRPAARGPGRPGRHLALAGPPPRFPAGEPDVGGIRSAEPADAMTGAEIRLLPRRSNGHSCGDQPVGPCPTAAGTG
jgi:hypothetical protein